jgi:hypothetical protein
MAVLGHKSLAEVENYTRSADQERLADSAIAAGSAEWAAALRVAWPHGSRIKVGTRVGQVEYSTETIAKTAQGPHPYRNGMDTTDVLNFPAVAEIVVTPGNLAEATRHGAEHIHRAAFAQLSSTPL